MYKSTYICTCGSVIYLRYACTLHSMYCIIYVTDTGQYMYSVIVCVNNCNQANTVYTVYTYYTVQSVDQPSTCGEPIDK